ncbi:MAG: precorrin-3B C(17)-methyltransferase [Chloroflexi bacterium]|nr:precorrin-3B C(17)-methyltransferase [Chloroflexota bacterium]
MSAGKILLIGLGPGERAVMTPAALKALSDCDAVVGYDGYLAQVGDLVSGKQVVSLPLGKEMERAGKAAELANEGLTVAVISSGDIGVYGMAGPVFEHLVSTGWNGEQPEVEVVPAVSAAQAAASVLGAPLMQDFCAISLSDLMTPWDTIRKRLDAAAYGDFVIALYNPRSSRRHKQIVEARDIVLKHRSAETPVGIVRNASRLDEDSMLTTLGELDSHFERIDMFTTLIIGNSTTYIHGRRMVTPRGYMNSRE